MVHIDTNTDKPIFIQIAEQLEDAIFVGTFPEETKIPSTNEISALLNINPHTVLKGMNMLVDEEIIYKRRNVCKRGCSYEDTHKATRTVF